MSDRDSIERQLREDRIPEAVWPHEWGEKKKRPKEIAFMDLNLCFPCGKCPEFCPVGCIEYLAPGTLPGRGDNQPVEVRFDECIGGYICVEVCALLTDYDAVRMYPTDLVERLLDVKIGNRKPDEYRPAEPYEELFSEGGSKSVRHLGNGSRPMEKINAEDRRRMASRSRSASRQSSERSRRCSSIWSAISDWTCTPQVARWRSSPGRGRGCETSRSRPVARH